MMSVLKDLVKMMKGENKILSLVDNDDPKTISGVMNFDWEYVCKLEGLDSEVIQEIRNRQQDGIKNQKYHIVISPVKDSDTFVMMFWIVSPDGQPAVMEKASHLKFGIEVDLEDGRRAVEIKSQQMKMNDRNSVHRTSIMIDDDSVEAEYLQNCTVEQSLLLLMLTYVFDMLICYYPPTTAFANNLEVDYTFYRSSENCCKDLYQTIIPGKIESKIEKTTTEKKPQRIIPQSFMTAVLTPTVTEPDMVKFQYEAYLPDEDARSFWYPIITIYNDSLTGIGYLAAIDECTLVLYQTARYLSGRAELDYPMEIGRTKVELVKMSMEQQKFVVESLLFRFADHLLNDRKTAVKVEFKDNRIPTNDFSGSVDYFLNLWKKYANSGWYKAKEISIDF